MALERDHQGQAKEGSEQEHPHIHKPGKSSEAIGCCPLAAPACERRTPKQAHHCRAEYAAITHARYHPGYEDQPK